MSDKTRVEYIYESPDGGKTVTRRKFGEQEREPIQSADEVLADLFTGTPAVSSLSEAQIEYKFSSIRDSLKNAQLRAKWTQDYTMAKHVSKSVELLEQLKCDVLTASATAKAAFKKVEPNKNSF